MEEILEQKNQFFSQLNINSDRYLTVLTGSKPTIPGSIKNKHWVLKGVQSLLIGHKLFREEQLDI